MNGLKLSLPLPLSLECWYFRCVIPSLVYSYIQFWKSTPNLCACKVSMLLMSSIQPRNSPLKLHTYFWSSMTVAGTARKGDVISSYLISCPFEVSSFPSFPWSQWLPVCYLCNLDLSRILFRWSLLVCVLYCVSASNSWHSLCLLDSVSGDMN